MARVAGLRDSLWVVQGLALATAVREFALLAETSWSEAPKNGKIEDYSRFWSRSTGTS